MAYLKHRQRIWRSSPNERNRLASSSLTLFTGTRTLSIGIDCYGERGIERARMNKSVSLFGSNTTTYFYPQLSKLSNTDYTTYKKRSDIRIRINYPVPRITASVVHLALFFLTMHSLIARFHLCYHQSYDHCSNSGTFMISSDAQTIVQVWAQTMIIIIYKGKVYNNES